MSTARNAPCPCGSGQKYKHCCGRSASATPGRADEAPLARQLQQGLQAGRFSEVRRFTEELISRGQESHLVYRALADACAGEQDFPAAYDAYRKALSLKPSDFVVLYNTGTAALRLERFEEAVQYLRKALKKQPRDPQVMTSYGVALAQLGRYAEAQQNFQHLIGIHPGHVDGYINLAVLHSVTGELEIAERMLDKAEKIAGPTLQTVLDRGLLAVKQGRPQEAVAIYRRLLSERPGEPFFLQNLEAALAAGGDWEEAAEVAGTLRTIDPSDKGALCRQALAVAKAGELEQALALLAPVQDSGDIEIETTFAQCYSEFGLVDKAVHWYRKVLDKAPLDPAANSAGTFLRHYLPGEREEELVATARHYMGDVESRATPRKRRRRGCARGKDGRIRLGFVSADLRRHSVGYFMKPVFEHLDASRFEVFVYDNSRSQDDMTASMQQHVLHWRFIESVDDAKAASLIVADKIDILVDLSGLTAGHRLPLFACRPAPLQVTWLGYPATTGLSRMDYRIVDAYTDPEGLTEQWHTETLWRLPEVFSVYSPPAEAPPVAPTPAKERGYVTFGTFNNYNKLNDEVLDLWAEILLRVPDSRMLLKSFAFQHAQTREHVMAVFEKRGIARERIRVLEPDKGLAEHLSRYGELDIGLDPFPYCGTTTTCEALWMGVPVISLTGQTHRARVGFSQLSNIGLPELAVPDKEAYIDKAVELAADLEALDALRAGMRERMRQSPLTDAPRFVRHLEEAFEAMCRS